MHKFYMFVCNMQRGKATLYNPIVPRSIAGATSGKKRNTGTAARRDAMAHRYYFHATINRLRYDDCLTNLSQEFFIQPITIVKELERCMPIINRLVKQRVTTLELRKQFPWYSWVSKMA